MKHIFCTFLLVFILVSCENSNQIKEIEMLTYFTDARDFEIYSITDKNGFTQTLFKSQTSKKYVDNYQSRIGKSLIDSIISICKNADNESFKFIAQKKMWYCGNWHSVQVTYENGEKIIFKYPYANNKNKQFIPFQSLNKQIQKDSLLATRLDIGQLGWLYIKQEDLSNYTFKKDSIEMKKYIEEHK